jgi:hypothetical protein
VVAGGPVTAGVRLGRKEEVGANPAAWLINRARHSIPGTNFTHEPKQLLGRPLHYAPAANRKPGDRKAAGLGSSRSSRRYCGAALSSFTAR